MCIRACMQSIYADYAENELKKGEKERRLKEGKNEERKEERKKERKE